MTNLASNIIDFVRVLSARDGAHNIDVTIRHAKPHELWLWHAEALAHEETSAKWERKLAKAVAHKIARECVRRVGPKSADNPTGHEEARGRTGDTQAALALGGTVD